MGRIVLVAPLPPPYNGQSVAVQMLADGLQERNILYSVVDTSSNRQIEGRAIPPGRILEYIWIMTKYFFRTMFGRKTVYITIGQFRAGFFRDLVVSLFAFLRGQRIVLHLHGGNYDRFYASQPFWLRRWIRWMLLKADVILVLGEGLRAMFDFEPLLRDRIEVVPNGLPFELKTQNKPKNLFNAGGKIRLLYLSNLIESKGYLDLLEAVDLLVKKHRLDIECRFCGRFLANRSDDVRVKSSEHGRALFERFVYSHQLEKHVYYHGVVSGDEKMTVLKNAHFFVLPTHFDCEGQPLSIIEAMAYGNVVISTNYRAIPDLILQGKTGEFVPYGQPESIAKVISDIVREPARYEEMSRSAIQHFQDNFTRERHLERIIPLLLPQ